jgi:formamidopyrimidine-DNA glycosylase
MPELPEVETLRQQLINELPLPVKIMGIKFSDKNLRTPFPRAQKKFFLGQVIVDIERRAKYLIFRFKQGNGFIAHLGMTGSWRIEPPQFKKQTHDHVVLSLRTENLKSSLYLIYNDPRRFGFFEILRFKPPNKLLKHLGDEPLGPDWTGERLYEKVHSRKSPIKNLLMNAAIVVGVGNIYASEALFRAGISPIKKGYRLKKMEVENLKTSVVTVLKEALSFGGSSIDDYRHLSGEKGQMQSRLKVYDRQGLACYICQNLIKKVTQSGRSTFYCPKCQK